MFPCALVGLLFPPPPCPATSMCPSCVSARPAVFYFFFFCARAPCCSRAPCVCPLLFFVLPWARYPAPPLSPVSPPILLLAVDPACTSALPVHAALSLACATRVPYPCPYPSPLPFPLGAPSVPASHPILAAWRPVCVGGGVSVVWTVALYPQCAPSQQGVEVRIAGHWSAVAPVVEVPAAVRSPLVVPVLAPTPGVLDSLHLSSRHRAIFVDYGTCSLLYLQSETGNAVPPPQIGCEDTEYTQCIRSSQ